MSCFLITCSVQKLRNGDANGIKPDPTTNPRRRNSNGTRRVYITTGDGYSDPAARTTYAFIAFDLDTGKMLWSRQLTENDSYTMGCGLPFQAAFPSPAK